MADETVFRLGILEDYPELEKLLEENNLPFQDLLSSNIEFIVATYKENIVGCIGLEIKGHNGLLRSFAVSGDFKNKAIGNRLFELLRSKAQTVGIMKLHLLTTTAELYFLRKGFKNEDRKNTPAEINESTEFSEICPSNSIYLTLNIQY